jgi:uncharacterized damage-inducible protein DinB
MKKLLVPYSAYHLWATQQLLNKIKELPDEIIHQKVKSSFESLFATVQHLWDAENIWWQRLKLVEQVRRPSENFTGSFAEMAANLWQQSKQWNDWVVAAQDHMLDHEFIYYNTKKEKFKQPVYQVLLHVFNHGTYHRGQLVTIMRQLQIGNIPNTDFIAWSRKK